MEWDDLRVFLTVVRRGSLSAAGEELRLSRETVSRSLHRLEASLSARLMERCDEGYVLTEAGEQLAERAQVLDETVASIEQTVLGNDARLSGPLTLHAPCALLATMLMRPLAQFCRQYPDISVEVAPSERGVGRPSDHGADLYVRFVPLEASPPPHLTGREIGMSARCAYAAPDFIARHSFSGEYATGHWIGWGDGEGHPAWSKATQWANMRVKGSVPDVLLQRDAAKAGLGVVLLPCFLGDRDPNLTRLPGGQPEARFGIWLLAAAGRRIPARVQLLSEIIELAIMDNGDLLEGRKPSLLSAADRETPPPRPKPMAAE